MATFIMKGTYSAEAIKAISGERTRNAMQIVKSCGGKVVSAYATMGDTDLLVVADFPGAGEAIKASVALNKALGIAFSTVPALDVKEFDKLFAK